MSQFDTGRNTLHAQILFWGPQGSGKTCLLDALRVRIDPERKSRLYSVAAPDGSTLAFDLLPVEEFRHGPVRVNLTLVAVPGRPTRGHARLTLLKEADAVVFVADARRSMLEANRESWSELQGTLKSLGAGALPTVWCFNKRDLLESASHAELAAELRVGTLPAYETSATDGHGVMESFAEVFRLVLEEQAHKYSLEVPDPQTPARMLPQLARGATTPLRPPPDRHLIVVGGADEHTPAEQALRAQIGIVRAHVDTETALRRLEDRNRELTAVNRVARSILSAMETDNLLVVLLDATTDYLDVSHATCILFDPTEQGGLRTHVRGFGRDPALGLKDDAARRFFELVRDSDGPVPLMEEYNPELLQAVQRVDTRVKRAMFQPIKGGHDKPSGWIGIYHTGDEPKITAQGLLFLSSISRLAALGLGKIALLERMQRMETRLDTKLRQRTGELEMAQAKVRALNRGLESRVKERVRSLEESHRRLREDHGGAVHAARLHAMGEVASYLVHEVQPPIASLAAGLDALREGLDELKAQVAAAAPAALPAAEELEARVARAEEQARRALKLVQSLQRFGGEDALARGFALNTLVADAAALLEERIGKSADLELSLGTVPELEGSGTELGHVVLGLMMNAIEAVEQTGRRGRIHVTTYSSGGKITLLVKDDGCGMDETILARVFEPFASTKKREPGAGLGLHSAYKAVKARGGTIRVRSRPDQGTTVTINLPVRGATETAAAEPDPALPQES